VVAATRVLGALFSPHCAAVQPALLTHGLAAAVERKGVRILEGADVVAIEPGRVRTSRHRVRAEVVLQATEAYGRDLPGQRRELVPVYSLMVATEPLTTAQWEAIGLHERATFNDARREVIYGQRTGDGRLAFGGRGAPYHLGSRIRPGFDVDARVRSRLVATLVDLFPSLADVTITHHWGGPLGIPRDWHPSVRYDPASGLGRAGGYVGDGVGATQLAGRTLADLVLRRDTDLVHLPWVDHHSPRWEPEPFRWLGVNGALRLARWIDRSEERRGRTPRWARVLDLLTGG
jgi:glycine/D-amino acid oxidase-like deaminating enzyme